MSLLLLLLSGCVDFYSTVRPKANENERWTSQEPKMFFGWDEGAGTFTGEITLNDGNVMPLEVLFLYGRGIEFLRMSEEETLIRGSCKFSPDELVVMVEEDKEVLLDGVSEIIFIREAKETVPPPHPSKQLSRS